MILIKTSQTLKETKTENRVGEIKKIKKSYLLHVIFGYTEIEYFWDSNDDVRPLESSDLGDLEYVGSGMNYT